MRVQPGPGGESTRKHCPRTPDKFVTVAHATEEGGASSAQCGSKEKPPGGHDKSRPPDSDKGASPGVQTLHTRKSQRWANFSGGCCGSPLSCGFFPTSNWTQPLLTSQRDVLSPLGTGEVMARPLLAPQEELI